MAPTKLSPLKVDSSTAGSRGQGSAGSRAQGSPTSPVTMASGRPSPSRASSFREALPSQALNKNVNWISSPGAWVFYISLIVIGWLSLTLLLGPGLAWTYIHLFHGVISYYLLHWNKGSPVEMDQGKYDSQTFWEQLDDGVQNTPNRKFFTIVPVVTFLLATHGSDFRKQPLGLNLIVLLVLLVAKFPGMHKVRIFGINKY